MPNEDKKDFNAMLHNSKDMPKVKDVLDKGKMYKLLIAAPLDYDALMKQVPEGKLLTTEQMRRKLAERYRADKTCPLTAGIFVNIVAWASEQRTTDITPYWRTIKTDGELNVKYPGGVEAQKAKLEAEGHTIVQRGRSKVKYYVQDFENALVELK